MSSEEPTTPQSQSLVPAVAEEAARSRTSGRLARRALFATAGAGLCCAGAVLAPRALEEAGKFTQAELRSAFTQGLDAGRQAVLSELAQLEGVTLDGALTVANLTHLAVQYIVVPVSRLLTFLGGNALLTMIGALVTARTNLARINVTIQQLNDLQDLLTTWRGNIDLLPMTLEQYANADISTAEAYLKALKRMVEQQASATPTPKK